MAFEEIGAPVWKGIGTSSSLVLIILSIYDVCISCWLFTEFSVHDHHLPLDITVKSYPGNYDVFRFVWVIVSFLLVVLHGFVFYGYCKNSENILNKCTMSVIAAVFVLVLLSSSYGSILADRHGLVISYIGHEIVLLTAAFLSTLAVEAVLMLAIILGK